MTLKHARMDVLWQAFQDAVSQNDWGIYEKAHSHAEKELQQLREQYACDGSLEDETVNCKRLIGQILGDTKQ